VHVSSKINLEKGPERLRNKIRKKHSDATGKKEEEKVWRRRGGWWDPEKIKKRNHET
jgi:hypothetical protein